MLHVDIMHADPTLLSASVRDKLLADHTRLENTLERLVVVLESNDQEQILSVWTDLESSLLLHLEAEENFLIPALLRARERDARTILAEHQHIRARLAELGVGIELHIVRIEVARAFVEELRAHARHEDTIYAWIEDHIGESDQKSLLAFVGRGKHS